MGMEKRPEIRLLDIQGEMSYYVNKSKTEVFGG